MNKTKIQFGDKVKCKYTGFTGIVMAKTEFINGCAQYTVAPRVGKGNKLMDDIDIDEQSLIVIKKKNVAKEEKGPGGPSTKSHKMKGF